MPSPTTITSAPPIRLVGLLDASFDRTHNWPAGHVATMSLACAVTGLALQLAGVVR